VIHKQQQHPLSVSITNPAHHDRIRDSTRAFQHASTDANGHRTHHTSWAAATTHSSARMSQNEYEIVLAQREAQVQRWLDEVKIDDE
jgi:hypothetical protein